MGKCMVLLKNWRIFFTILYPLSILWVPIVWYQNENDLSKEPLAAYVILLMIGYYMTECVNLSITSLIPVILFPIFQIQDTDAVTRVYLSDSILFLFGGCVIALSFEYSNLHIRIAMKVISLIGAKTGQLLFGIVFTSMFLSMWMNNTSTTAMMVPICNAIVHEVEVKMVEYAKNPNKKSSTDISKKEDVKEGGEDGKDKEDKKSIKSGNKEDNKSDKKSNKESKVSVLTKEEEAELVEKVEKKVRNLRILLFLGAAYGSNIGGTGLITGTATNLVALDLFKKPVENDLGKFKNPDKCENILVIDFITWIGFNIVPMIINSILAWFWLLVYFTGCPDGCKCCKCCGNKELAEDKQKRTRLEKSIKRAMKRKYKELGPMSLHEWFVIVFFIIIVLLWIFRSPKIFDGWGDAIVKAYKFPKGFRFTISDATPTFLICILMIIFPRKGKHYKEWKTGGLGRGLKKPVLTWSYIYKKMPWGIFILLGGGSAMAAGARASGLSAYIGKTLANSELIKNMSQREILLFAMFLAAAMTAVSSNAATSAILVPVLLDLSFINGYHPYYLALTATIVCSYGFTLPVSTPPNAIVYDAAQMQQKEMAIPGLMMTLICLLVLWIWVELAATFIWKFDTYHTDLLYCQYLGEGNSTSISTTPK